MSQQRITIDKSFVHWAKEDLEVELNVFQKRELPPLQDWLEKEVAVTEAEVQYLEELREGVAYYIDSWNEAELREKLIGVVVRLVKYENSKYRVNTFAERTLTARTQIGPFNVKLHGTIDWLTATGLRNPKRPFFFIHEYKAVPGKVVEGAAQLIAAMYAAQLINQLPPKPSVQNPNPKHFYKDMPIYGVYVDGRNWFFVALEGNHYAVSEAYVFTNKGVPAKIFKHLKAQKQMIYSYFE